ncbi:prenyltransferase [Megasphaera vaginalis (ex Bordigoni et al. 2020)]|uniref:prenyltransferase n=1 Tax=Megasphaera vaginalis (ex Bordigoni et al. 2020) TaxID=2045301 RepID=UPI001F2EDE04|nr:prenyltransferase [Megasphaera vaginalis (ex Bordigoni et al. 2020)]
MMAVARSLTPADALHLAAPHTWIASVYPALFGELYCLQQGYALPLPTALCLVTACICMQASVNTLNDYFDFINGTDTADDFLEKSDAVLVHGSFPVKQALYLGIAYLFAAALIVFPVLITAGPIPLIIGATGALAVCTYSGGRLPISYLPLGELISGLTMGGLIPLGVVAVASQSFHAAVLPAALPLILGIGLIMLTNNTCDLEKDEQACRRTLPVLLGRKKALTLYRGCVVLWFATLCLLPFWYTHAWGIGSLLLLIVFARPAFRRLLRFTLTAPQRVAEMKGIVLANLLGNGAYLISFAAAITGGFS